jgi:PTS system mannose-specific IID component
MPFPKKVLFHTFLRTYLVGSCFNTRGMQNVGLELCMDPGLRELYPDTGELQKARRRYVKLYNTHPYWTPLIVGVFLFLEQKIADGVMPASSLPKVKSTTVYTLSAIGDSLFSGSVMVFWSLMAVLLLLQGWHGAALFWGVTAWVGLQLFKVYTFCRGVSEGIGVLQRLRSWNLMLWSRRIKLANGLLVAGLWVELFPLPLGWLNWVAGAGTLGLFALLCLKLLRMRELLLVMFLFLWSLLPDFLEYVSGI